MFNNVAIFAESPKFAQICTIVLYPNDYITHPIIIDFDFWATIIFTLWVYTSKYNLSNTGYPWASQLTCCISATNPVICGIFATTYPITKHIYLFIQYVFIYMYSLCIYWYVCLHYVSIDIYLFIQYVFICIYWLCMYSYVSIYPHSRSLTSHLCNICCIFATLKNLLRLCNFCGTYATSVVYIQHIGRDTPSGSYNFKFRLTDKSEGIWKKQLFTRVFLEIWRCGEGLKTLFSVYYWQSLKSML